MLWGLATNDFSLVFWRLSTSAVKKVDDDSLLPGAAFQVNLLTPQLSDTFQCWTTTCFLQVLSPVAYIQLSCVEVQLLGLWAFRDTRRERGDNFLGSEPANTSWVALSYHIRSYIWSNVNEKEGQNLQEQSGTWSFFASILKASCTISEVKWIQLAQGDSGQLQQVKYGFFLLLLCLHLWTGTSLAVYQANENFPMVLCFGFGFASSILARLIQCPAAATPDCLVILVMPSHIVALQFRLHEQQILHLCFA